MPALTRTFPVYIITEKTDGVFGDLYKNLDDAVKYRRAYELEVKKQ